MENTANLKLWLIERTDEVGYDENVAFVIAASHPATARTVASNREYGDERQGVWLDPTQSTVTLIGDAVKGVKEGIILTDFRNG